ncbi:MAG TPA: hypothetical protein VLG16_00215 [Candidatus Saccharimonadales bacterium]|nr:hypothetical protein [Candidatus Saccharimonadales bacterium]
MPEQNNLSQPGNGTEQNSSPKSQSRVRRFLGKLGLGGPRNHMSVAQQEYPRPINLQPKRAAQKLPEVERDLPAFAVVGQNPKTGATEFYSQPSTTPEVAQGEPLPWKTNGVIGGQPGHQQDALPYTFTAPKPPRKEDFDSSTGIYGAAPNAQLAQSVPGSENHGNTTQHPMPPTSGIGH